MKQAQALSVMHSGASVFLTGPPGSGKTFVLNSFVKQAVREGKVVAVTASTGIAATHIGGTTIHSWSGLGIHDQLLPRDRQQLAGNANLVKRYNATDVLVIDEVSMLHGQRLDMINEVCKLLRKDDLPFGGLQVILVGDLFQLPPVSRQTDELDFVHLSQAWAELNPKICYLSEQHRLQADGLLSLLEAMRIGELTEAHDDLLQQRLAAKPSYEQEITRLYAHNVDIDSLNQQRLDALKDKPRVFAMHTQGTAAKVEQLRRSVLAPESLELKVGAEVMFVANNPAAGFVNGTRGQVVKFQDGQPVVKLSGSERTIKVSPHSWKLEEDGKTKAEVTQLPLRLAWAITIHKSQGMSLDAAQIDLSKSFTPGMGYVALSRVRSAKGLYLSGINAMALRLHPQIYELDQSLRQASDSLAAVTPDYVPPAKIAEPVARVDKVLLEKLKQWRLLRAKRDKVPAYIVAHDSVLEQIASKPPQTPQSLLGLKGFGPSKLAAYGDEILALTRQPK
ncbi:MAG: HRDC domain-containing protein [Candidatus Saccharimonadales bacterium]